MDDATENLLEKAEYLTEIERWQEAIPLLLKVLARSPENFQANCLLSLCHFHLGDHGKALQFAETGIQAAPDEEWGHRLRSIALNGQGRKKEAVKSAEEAARLAPYEPFALQALANAYLEIRQPRKAQSAAEKMCEIAPEMESSHFTLGNVYLARGHHYQAENCFREALRINPNFADARNNLGVAILRQTDQAGSFNKPAKISILQTAEADEVHTHFSEAMKLEPGNEVAAENLRFQFDYLVVIYGLLIFVPFLLLAFFIAPGWTILIALIGAATILKQLWEVFQKRRNLSPELKMFLRSTRKGAFKRFGEFYAIIRRVLRRTWKPHLLAALALGFRFLYGMPNFHKSGWNDYAAYVLLIAAIIWFVSELRKD